jgi:hypothetical protein
MLNGVNVGRPRWHHNEIGDRQVLHLPVDVAEINLSVVSQEGVIPGVVVHPLFEHIVGPAQLPGFLQLPELRESERPFPAPHGGKRVISKVQPAAGSFTGGRSHPAVLLDLKGTVLMAGVVLKLSSGTGYLVA